MRGQRLCLRDKRRDLSLANSRFASLCSEHLDGAGPTESLLKPRIGPTSLAQPETKHTAGG